MEESFLRPYLPVAIYAAAVFGTGALLLTLPMLVGPRRPSRSKQSTYECGATPFGDARQKISIRFYLVAILFVLFDIETVFLVPWAVVYRSLGLFGLVEMLVFLAILAFGLIYAWRTRALEWD